MSLSSKSSSSGETSFTYWAVQPFLPGMSRHYVCRRLAELRQRRFSSRDRPVGQLERSCTGRELREIGKTPENAIEFIAETSDFSAAYNRKLLWNSHPKTGFMPA